MIAQTIRGMVGTVVLLAAPLAVPAHADTASTPTLQEEASIASGAIILGAELVAAPVVNPVLQLPVLGANVVGPVVAPVVAPTAQAVAAPVAQIQQSVQQSTAAVVPANAPVAAVATSALQPVVDAVNNETRAVLGPFGVPDQLITIPALP